MTREQAAILAAIDRQAYSPTALPYFPGLTTAPARTEPGRLARAWPAAKRLGRFARTFALHPVSTGQTCVRAAKLLPTVRQAIPRWVWPILGLATAVKCLPLDMGADETLFCLAFALIGLARPGLLTALYREAQAGKPAWCQCPPCSARWQRKQARRAAFRHPFGTITRKAVAR